MLPVDFDLISYLECRQELEQHQNFSELQISPTKRMLFLKIYKIGFAFYVKPSL